MAWVPKKPHIQTVISEKRKKITESFKDKDLPQEIIERDCQRIEKYFEEVSFIYMSAMFLHYSLGIC